MFPPQLISYWNFDETSGPAIDSADSNDGTLGSAVSRVTGIIGSGALAFDNTSGSYVDAGAGTSNNFSVTDGVTIEAMIVSNWTGAFLDYDEIFRKEDGSSRMLLSFQNDSNNPIGPVLSLGLNIGGVYSELDMPLDGVAGRPTVADLTDGNPHHVVGTYDVASGLKALYIDGTLRYSTSYAPGTPISSGGGAPATIGNLFPAGPEPFSGVIDEVAFWGRALSASEIAQHYANAQNGQNYFTVVPEPSSMVFMAWGMVGLGLAIFRRLRRHER